jgi:catechol 2,3-dioxygenase-like lactoylglutathione lyase family enzyme
MGKASSARVTVTGIPQVGIAVRDIDSAVEAYWSVLGIGPWNIYAWEAPTVYDRMYDGKSTWAREKTAKTMVGGLELELVQTVEGDSTYRDFIAQHGEGLHHLKFLVDDVDEVASILAEQGFKSLQSGRFGVREHRGAFNYVQIDPLHTIWEPSHMGQGTGATPIRRHPAGGQASPARVTATTIPQVGIAVADIDSTVEAFWRILGIGPWSIYAWEAPTVYGRTYGGKPAWAREKTAKTMVGGLELELVQTVEGDSTYRDFIAEHGEGLHHLKFLVDDVDEAAKILAEQGFASLQSGRFGAAEHRGAFNYIQIDPLHTIWEPTHMGQGTGARVLRHYPDT